MKSIISVFSFFVLLTATSEAQTLNGKYIDTSQLKGRKYFNGEERVPWYSLDFKDGMVTFYLEETDGYGTYRIADHRLFITPVYPDIKTSEIKAEVRKRNDFIDLTIIDQADGQPIPGVTLMIKKNSRITWTQASSTNGIGRIPVNKISFGDTVTLSYLGHYNVKLKLDSLHDYNITMFLGRDPSYGYDLISNNGKGHPIKIHKNFIKVNLKPLAPDTHDNWRKFTKDRTVPPTILRGKYVDSSRNQTLVFNGKAVQFNLWTNFCLTNNYIGNGTYQIIKKRLIINPILPTNRHYSIEQKTSISKDLLSFKLTDANKKAIAGASVLVIRNQKTIYGMATSSGGVAKLARNKILPTDSVRISFIGFYTVTLKPDTLSDYNLTMFIGSSDEAYINYVSNHSKGYPIKIRPNSIMVNFKQPGCGNPNAWKEFKKVD